MIESVNNERVKEIAKLHDKKYRKINNKFLAVGKHLVEEALKKNLVIELFLLEGTTNIYGFDATYVSEKVMKKLSEQTSSPKELAVCKIENNNEIIGNVVMLDNIKDPGNLGTIIRSAVAFNYQTIILSKECVDVYNGKVIRSSEGMLFNINIIIDDIEKYIYILKNNGYKIYSTDVVTGVSPQKENNKHAIIIGSEASGVKDSVKALADQNLKLAMNPLCESLNAGVSASILMYELGGKR